MPPMECGTGETTDLDEEAGAVRVVEISGRPGARQDVWMTDVERRGQRKRCRLGDQPQTDLPVRVMAGSARTAETASTKAAANFIRCEDRGAERQRRGRREGCWMNRTGGRQRRWDDEG